MPSCTLHLSRWVFGATFMANEAFEANLCGNAFLLMLKEKFLKQAVGIHDTSGLLLLCKPHLSSSCQRPC
jgi:hypothetical protein